LTPGWWGLGMSGRQCPLLGLTRFSTHYYFLFVFICQIKFCVSLINFLRQTAMFLWWLTLICFFCVAVFCHTRRSNYGLTSIVVQMFLS
jgi:hypothetical protein